MAYILLVNDDGYLSPGLTALADALSPLCSPAGKLTVIAPHHQASWIGKASSYKKELKLRTRTVAGRDVFTLEGTLEAVLAGIPALAVGIEIPYDTLTHLEFNQVPEETGIFTEAAALSARFAELLLLEEELPPLLYNLNFPGSSAGHAAARQNLPANIRLARPARYDYGPFLEANGKGFHHKGVRKDYSQAEPGTDMHAIAEGYASLRVLALYGALESPSPAVLKALGRIIEQANSGVLDG